MGAWPKVLIGVPVFEGTKYCLEEFFESVRAMTYPNADVLLVDNSRGNDFFEELKKEGDFIVVKDETTAEKPAERLVSSRNLVLDYAIKGGYDYVFALDSDVVCPKNLVEELMRFNKDIISGLYFNYFMVSGKLQIHSVAWRGITPEEFEIIKQQVRFSDAVKSHEDLQRHLTKQEIDSNGLFEVIYPSAGCMLISKEVFWKIRYGVPEMQNKNLTAGGDDIYFMQQARKAGFKAYCHTGFKCDHLIDGKFKQDSEGRLLHPLNPDYYKKD
ncbi:MAG: glycosyltransferase [archaeon]